MNWTPSGILMMFMTFSVGNSFFAFNALLLTNFNEI